MTQEPEVLLGREADVRLVKGHLTDAATIGAALLLVGEAGIGKTALLRQARIEAISEGWIVLDVGGGQFDGISSWGGLRRLLEPLRGRASRLTGAHAAALATVLEGEEVETPPERAVLGSAVVALVRAAASRAPVLITVDDAQWLDPASADIIAYTARRLNGTRAGLLAATRPGFVGPLQDAVGQHHRVSPLTFNDAHALLQREYPSIPSHVRDQVVAEAAGNPLALLELPRSPVGNGRLPTLEQAAASLQHDKIGKLFGPRVQALPQHSRDVMLVAALEGSGHLGTVAAAVGAEVLGALTPAEHSALITVEETQGRLTFRHPLVPATVVALATAAEKRAAHSLLAAVLGDDPQRRVWHLAAAVERADEDIALLLEVQAHTSLTRGDATTASQLLLRAGELSKDAHGRARRQLHAAFIGADITGDLAGAARLLADAEQVGPTLVASLSASVAASYLLLNAECDVDTAHRLLGTAIDLHPGRFDRKDPVLEDALHSLLMMSWFGGRRELWTSFERALDRLAPSAPALIELCHRTFGDPVYQANGALNALNTALLGIDVERDPLRITRIGLACVYTDRLGECRPALRRVIKDGREGGAVALAINALVSSCVDDWLTGQWDEARELAAEGVRLCEQHGYRRYSVILGGYIDQLVRVARGDLEGGREAAQEMAQWAADRGAGMSALFAEHLYTLRAIALGEYEPAYAHATRISAPGRLEPYNPHAMWVLFDLVESAMRTGRHAEASLHVMAMKEKEIGRISSRLQMLVDGCSALCQSGADARRMYESALAVPEGPRWPFDRARIQLAYGEQLRSEKDPSARDQLAEAAATFRQLGASPWTTRAQAVLRASGIGGAPDGNTSRRSLTPREREVAELAAEGLSNRQIAERLFLSPRSVGAVLYRVFPKLGVTSRAALAAILESETGEDAAGHAADSSARADTLVMPRSGKKFFDDRDHGR